jgi:hypothetical protein
MGVGVQPCCPSRIFFRHSFTQGTYLHTLDATQGGAAPSITFGYIQLFAGYVRLDSRVCCLGKECGGSVLADRGK